MSDIQNKLEEMAAAYADQLTKFANEILEEDSIGEMMSFMDAVKYPYSHHMTDDDGETHVHIRKCFLHAFCDEVYVLGNTVNGKVKQDVLVKRWSRVRHD